MLVAAATTVQMTVMATEELQKIQDNLRHKVEEPIGEPELARLSVFQRRFLRLQFLAGHRSHRWSANPVTSDVTD